MFLLVFSLRSPPKVSVRDWQVAFTYCVYLAADGKKQEMARTWCLPQLQNHHSHLSQATITLHPSHTSFLFQPPRHLLSSSPITTKVSLTIDTHQTATTRLSTSLLFCLSTDSPLFRHFYFLCQQRLPKHGIDTISFCLKSTLFGTNHDQILSHYTEIHESIVSRSGLSQILNIDSESAQLLIPFFSCHSLYSIPVPTFSFSLFTVLQLSRIDYSLVKEEESPRKFSTEES